MKTNSLLKEFKSGEFTQKELYKTLQFIVDNNVPICFELFSIEDEEFLELGIVYELIKFLSFSYLMNSPNKQSEEFLEKTNLSDYQKDLVIQNSSRKLTSILSNNKEKKYNLGYVYKVIDSSVIDQYREKEKYLKYYRNRLIFSDKTNDVEKRMLNQQLAKSALEVISNTYPEFFEAFQLVHSGVSIKDACKTIGIPVRKFRYQRQLCKECLSEFHKLLNF